MTVLALARAVAGRPGPPAGPPGPGAVQDCAAASGSGSGSGAADTDSGARARAFESVPAGHWQPQAPLPVAEKQRWGDMMPVA